MNLPLLINMPESMLKMRVVTTKDRSERVLKTLHGVGVLHVEQSEELKPVNKAAIDEARGKVNELLEYTNEMISYAPEKDSVFLKENVRAKYLRPFKEIEGDVKSLYAGLTDLYKKAATLGKEIERLRKDERYLRPLAQQLDLSLSDLSFSGKYLFSRVFVLPTELQETFLDRIRAHIFHSVIASTEDEAILYIIARVEGRKDVETAAKDLGCHTLEITPERLILDRFLGIAEAKLHELGEELNVVSQALQIKTREHLEEIVLLKEVLSAESERLSVLDKASEAKYVAVIEGWIPEASVESAAMKLKEDIEYVFVDVRAAAESEGPPTKLRNLKGLRPFEVIVELFGIPKYKEWDPTPLIAYSFAVFFGLMMGDVVYALGLILVTKFLLKFLVDDPNTDGVKQFKNLLYTSSCTALLVGLFTGTYLGNIYEFFGIETGALATVPLIRDKLVDPISFITISMVIGIIHVNIGHVLAFVKGIKEGNKAVVINKIGLFIFEIFGIPVLFRAMLNVNLLPMSDSTYSLFGYIMALGLVTIVVSAFMDMGGLGAIFWFFDVTGLLGDVMSYCRLAGVGLAAMYLAESFNMLAEWIYSMISSIAPGVLGLILGGIFGFFVLAFGHMLNLMLGALAAFIHSLRLCFVEFLLKFYEGGGRPYTPFQLRTWQHVVLR